MMNLKTYYSANSDTATHQSNEWITGKIAGIFEWDSAASKYSSALDDSNKDGFTVGEEIKFGDNNGGFSKVSTGSGYHQDLQERCRGCYPRSTSC
ncbi:MAG: hypothetical protein ACLVES_04765 [Faecalibacterium prausnitzii]